MKHKNIIILDTNILYSKEYSELINSETKKIIEDYKNEFSIQIHLPEVVRGELIYQKFKESQDSLRHINGHIEKINTITSKEFKHALTDHKIKNAVEKKYEAWINKNHIKIISIPFDSIDWEELANCAIWRVPPFEQSSKKEKGFRDHLIMETTIHFTSNHPNEYIHFISNDKLLRETTAQKLKSNKFFSSYESIDELVNYLKLRSQNLTNKFINEILDKAYQKSFDILEEKGIVQELSKRSTAIISI